jgi:hypothetical protein
MSQSCLAKTQLNTHLPCDIMTFARFVRVRFPERCPNQSGFLPAVCRLYRTGVILVLDRDCRSATRGNLHGLGPDSKTTSLPGFLPVWQLVMMSAGVQCTGLSLVLDRDCRGATGGNVHRPEPGSKPPYCQAFFLFGNLYDGVCRCTVCRTPPCA